jgi:hypothetical protein
VSGFRPHHGRGRLSELRDHSEARFFDSLSAVRGEKADRYFLGKGCTWNIPSSWNKIRRPEGIRSPVPLSEDASRRERLKKRHLAFQSCHADKSAPIEIVSRPAVSQEFGNFFSKGGWPLIATCDGCRPLSLRSPQAMARRIVRRSVRTKSRTDQVGGAKQRRGYGVLPIVEQEAAIHLYPFLDAGPSIESVIWNAVPSPSLLSTVIVPPWASTTSFTILVPRPVPPTLRLIA